MKVKADGDTVFFMIIGIYLAVAISAWAWIYVAVLAVSMVVRPRWSKAKGWEWRHD